MPKLISLNEQYKEKGLVMIFVGYESRAKLEPFTKQYKITWPVAIDPSKKTHDSYGVKAYPTVFLIAPSGKIAWQGHHMDKKFEQIFKALLPKVKKSGLDGKEDPAKLVLEKDVVKRLQLAVRKAKRGDLGGALRLAQTVLKDDRAKEEEKEDAKYVKEEVEKHAAGLFAEVKRLLKEKMPYEAKQLLIKIRRAFAGMDNAKKAQEMISTMDADVKLADELKAGELFAKALKEQGKGYPKNAQKLFEQIVEEYPDTEYAKRAGEKLKQNTASDK